MQSKHQIQCSSIEDAKRELLFIKLRLLIHKVASSSVPSTVDNNYNYGYKQLALAVGDDCLTFVQHAEKFIQDSFYRRAETIRDCGLVKCA